MNGSELGYIATGIGSVVFAYASIKLYKPYSLGINPIRLSLSEREDDFQQSISPTGGDPSANEFIKIHWPETGGPIISGNISWAKNITGSDNITDFSTWLPTYRYEILEQAVRSLKSNGTPFSLELPTYQGSYLKVEGSVLNNELVLNINMLDPFKRELIELKSENENLKVESIGLRAMLDTLSYPVWLRSRSGKLTWTNEQYAFAVDAENAADVIRMQIELLDPVNIRNSNSATAAGNTFHSRIPLVVAGQRRIYDIVETPFASGTIGYAVDMTELEATNEQLNIQISNHASTLNQLPTAVSIFNEKQQLIFCNLAYRTLWQIDDVFINSMPTDGEILDRLRDGRKLPEQVDYKGWKKTLHESYHQLVSHEYLWHLPDGKTLRVISNPNPQGGVTYLYEDLTAHILLQSNFNALSLVQSETIESLKEGVAVFGPDGKLKLINPSILKLWDIDEALLKKDTHIEEFISQAKILYPIIEFWFNLQEMVVGISDERIPFQTRLERNNGSVLDFNLTPLPDGATLLTFADITASVSVERALKERNDALESAGKLRENFVHHVSYQLRSPLTNVIGFTELLASGAAGNLSEKQNEYIDHVRQSSNSLMAIIDDILDLASFDRGEIELKHKRINLGQVINAAISGLTDRINEKNIKIDIKIKSSVEHADLDPDRLRQIIFNLLSNAISFSINDQPISISVEGDNTNLSLIISDQGRGIPEDVIERVFDRFETYSVGAKHRGVGLGLSIVRALVELHGGTVYIQSEIGTGTSVICNFPLNNSVNIHHEVV